jgi:hypothetical protein
VQHDAPAHGHEDRHAVGRRRGIADVAGDGAGVLDLHAADLACRRLESVEERRKVGAQDVGPGRRRADVPAAIVVAADAAQAADPGDVEHRRGQWPADVRRIDVGTAGQHRPRSGREQAGCTGDRIGPLETMHH